MLLTILSTLVPIFGIIGLGLLVARKGIMPMDAAGALNQFVYWISLPAMMINALGQMDPARLSSRFFAALFGAALLSYLTCLALTSGFFRKSKKDATMLSFLSVFPNAAFMGMPIISFLLPGDGHALLIGGLCVLCYMPVMPYTDTALDVWARGGQGSGAWRILVRSLSRNPLVLAGAFGLVISLSGIPLPTPVFNMMGMLGSTAAPCALFAMGMVMNAQLATAGLFSPNWRKQFAVHLVKLALMPLLTYLSLRLLGVSGSTLGVTTLMSALPIGVSAYVIAEKYQVCVQETSMGIILNTLASIITIPALIALLYKAGAL